MQQINLAFLEATLGPLVGGADDDEQTERYKNFDSNNEVLVKNVIATTIKIAFDAKTEPYKSEVKKALAFSLLTNYNFEGIFDSNLVAFEAPCDPRNFFFWTWEILFPRESIGLDYSIETYTVITSWQELLTKKSLGLN